MQETKKINPNLGGLGRYVHTSHIKTCNT